MTQRLWKAELQRRWLALQPRERAGLTAAALALALFAVWTLGLAPALKTLREAPAQHQRLDAQMQRMQAWQAQAEALQAQPKKAAEQWRDGLAASVRTLGAAELVWAGNSATVRLKDCTPQALGQWLSELGPQWQLQLGQASLQLSAEGLWQGQLQLSKP